MSNVFRYEQVLIAPTDVELERVLTEAAQAANKGARGRTLNWIRADTQAVLSGAKAIREGVWQWTGQSAGGGRDSGNVTRSLVAVAWWTDPLKRLHYRIAADRISWARNQPGTLFCPSSPRPPLWIMYPENVYLRDSPNAPPWVICRCGVAGTPESVGWMGLHCAACHDREQEGTTNTASASQPCTTVLAGHERWVGPVVFTPDGRTIIAGARCGTRILAWDLAKGTPREVYSSPGQLSALALSPDGQTLAVGGLGQAIRLLSMHNGSVVQTIAVDVGTFQGPEALAFGPDGSLLAAALPGGLEEGQVELWDLVQGTRKARVADSLSSVQEARCLAFAPDGRTLAVGHGYGLGLLLWDLATQRSRNLKIPRVDHGCKCVAFSPDGQFLGVVVDNPGSVYLIKRSSGRVLVDLDIDCADSLAFSPDGQVLAVAGNDSSLRFFSVPQGEELGVFFWHRETLNDLAFSSAGVWLATSSDDGFVKLWPFPALLQAANASSSEAT
jgi:WD40 repeat protein